MGKPVIICIDDEATVINSLKIELKKAIGDECIIETAEGGKDAIELVNELLAEGSEVALVLSDYIMPDLKGDEVLKQIHSLSPNTLTIMLTGQADLEAVGKAIKYAKLYRYIPKPWQAEDLKLTVVEAVHSYLQDKKLKEQNFKLKQLNEELERLTKEQTKIIYQRTSELEKLNRELDRLAHLDGLTELANRRQFDKSLSTEWLRMSRDKQPLSLILGDVDNFKNYNDEYGHLQGDDCLKKVAHAISRVAKRPADLVARYGGEEFAIILPNTNQEGAFIVAEEIRKSVRQLFISHPTAQAEPYITVSLGVATLFPCHAISALALLNAADESLYLAKKLGRNQTILHDDKIVQKLGFKLNLN